MRRRSHCTSASNWDSRILRPGSLVILNVSLMRAHLGMYLPNFTTAIRDHTNVERVIMSSAENGPAMAGPAGPVPAPMQSGSQDLHTTKQLHYNK